MYHEEKVIAGVLSWRSTPNGEWTAYTAEALSVALVSERGRSEIALARVEVYAEQIAAAKECLRP